MPQKHQPKGTSRTLRRRERRKRAASEKKVEDKVENKVERKIERVVVAPAAISRPPRSAFKTRRELKESGAVDIRLEGRSNAAVDSASVLMAPDKRLLNRGDQPCPRWPVSGALTSTFVGRCDTTVVIPPENYAVFVFKPTGPMYSGDQSVQVSAGAVAGAFIIIPTLPTPSSAFIPTFDGGNFTGSGSTTTNPWRPMSLNYGTLISDHVMGFAAPQTEPTPGGQEQYDTHEYRQTGGVMRLTWPQDQTTNVSGFSLVSTTGQTSVLSTASDQQPSGAPYNSLFTVTEASVRGAALGEVYEVESTSTLNGLTTRYVGPTDSSRLTHPYPLNNLCTGPTTSADEVLKLLRLCVKSDGKVDLTKLSAPTLRTTAPSSYYPSKEPVDTFNMVVLFNNSAGESLDVKVQAAFSAEFIADNDTGLDRRTVAVDPQYDNIVAASRTAPHTTGPHSFWDFTSKVWDGVKSGAQWAWDRVVQPAAEAGVGILKDSAAEAAMGILL